MHLRVFIPMPAWDAVGAVALFQAELSSMGAWRHLRKGDVVRNMAFPEGNQGRLVFDGELVCWCVLCGYARDDLTDMLVSTILRSIAASPLLRSVHEGSPSL